MSNLRLVLYGNDQGANNVLDSVEKAAREEGFNIQRIPGLNLKISEENRNNAISANAAVFGVSCGMPEAHFAHDLLIKNPMLNEKILFCEDFPASNGTQDAALCKVGYASHLCAIFPYAPDATERSVYKEIHNVGYPDHWLSAIEKIGVGMDMRKQGVICKKRRGSNETQPINPKNVVVYLSGFYEPKIEATALSHLLFLKKVLGKDTVIHFRAHPGEKNRSELASAIQNRDSLLKEQWEIANKEIVEAGRDSDSLLMGVADIIVVNPGATATFFAGSFRKKIISVMEFVRPEDYEKSSYDYSLTRLRTHVVERIIDLQGAIESLLTDGSKERMELEEKQCLNTIPFDPGHPPSYGKNVVGIVKNLFA